MGCDCNGKLRRVLSTRVRERGYKARRIQCGKCGVRWTTIEIPQERFKAVQRVEAVMVKLRKAGL